MVVTCRLGYHAFRRVLQRSPAQYAAVVKAVETELGAARAKLGREGSLLLERVTADANTSWADARGWRGARG